MKMYEKNDLTYKNGLLVASDGSVVAIDNAIVDMANELETRIQQADYLKAQPQAVDIPTLNGFERKSEKEITPFVCETPVMDARTEQSMAIMDEIDSIAMTSRMNEQLKELSDLVVFAKEPTVFSAEQQVPHRFDVPTMGNPLEWDEDKILEFIARANGCDIEEFGTRAE